MAEAERQELDEELEEIYLCVEKMVFLFDIIDHLIYNCILEYSMKDNTWHKTECYFNKDFGKGALDIVPQL